MLPGQVVPLSCVSRSRLRCLTLRRVMPCTWALLLSAREWAQSTGTAPSNERGLVMNYLRTWTGRSPAILGWVAALVFLLGGGAYAATQRASAPAQPQAAALAWHRLHLINGWQPVHLLGFPSYAVRGDIVYLRGALHGGTSIDFATLPSSARPTHSLLLDIYSNGSNAQLRGLFVGNQGLMQTFDPNAQVSSLAGVSFPRSS